MEPEVETITDDEWLKLVLITPNYSESDAAGLFYDESVGRWIPLKLEHLMENK